MQVGSRPLVPGAPDPQLLVLDLRPAVLPANATAWLRIAYKAVLSPAAGACLFEDMLLAPPLTVEHPHALAGLAPCSPGGKQLSSGCTSWRRMRCRPRGKP